MPDEVRLAGAFVLALTTTLAVTPLAIGVATRTGFHDRPLDYKQHLSPVPYLGGAAVLGGFLLGAVIAGDRALELAPILLCVLFLWGVGTLDDRTTVSPLLRIAAEGVAAVVLWASGLGWQLVDSEVMNLLVTVIWTVGLVNAFNLIDNADGAAGTVGAVTALAVGALALIQQDLGLAILVIGLAGACIGFLRYNLAAPPRIFLGDGGSLPIGFVLAAAIMALPGEHVAGWPVLLAALLLAGLPVLDTALVIVSRRRRGLPVFRGGRDHLAHRMVGRFRSPRAIAALLGVAQAALGLVAIGVVQLGEGSVVTAWCIWFTVCAGVVAFLETRAGIAVPEGAPSVAPGETRGLIARLLGGGRRDAPSLLEGALIVVIGLTCGLSPFVSGFYDLSVWGPITLILLASLVGLTIARPAIPRASALVAVAGLAGLWLWSLLSTSWAESSEQALLGANRWLFYAALLGILILLLRRDAVCRLLLATTTGAILLVGLYVVGRMVVGEGEALLFSGRLDEPLGSINGEAGFFLLGLWPLVAFAERAEKRSLAAAAVAGASLLVSLSLLTQSRAVVLVLGVSVLALVAFVPGRLRRCLILLAAFGAVALEAPLLIDVYDSTGGGEGAVDTGSIVTAGVVAIVGALVAGAVWGVADHAVSRLAEDTRARVSTVTAWGLVGVLSLVLIAGAAVTNPIEKIGDQADEFTTLGSDDGSASRLSSGGGNRYDYWRIAFRQFQDRPVEGVGAGNYDSTYFRQRRTDEDIRQPHSLPLQTLGELGLVGSVALLVFLAGVLIGLIARVRAGGPGPKEAVTVAAGGSFLIWLVHTSVDWLHLIPGLTGIAICAAAVLVSPWRAPGEGNGALWPRRIAVTLVVIGAVLGAVLVGRAALAERYRSDAREQLASDPVAALEKADDSLALSGESLETLYVKAGAFARLDRYDDARATLLEATRLEPSDFVPWALLGDLAVRRRDVSAARGYYGRAVELNPRDEGLERQADDPLRPVER